jgi:hypothetical protein
MGVELGAVDAGVDGLAADLDAAAAAHPGAVEHDRVQRCERRNAVGPGDLGDGPHHGDRADGVHGVDAARLDDVLERLGDEAVPPIAPVVGARDDLARAAQLVLEDDPLLRAAADDARHLHPGLGQPEGDGVDDRGPHSAPDAHGVPGLDELGRPPEGAGHVLDRFPDLERDEVLGALADGLDDQSDRAPPAVRVGDGERDPLGAGAAVDDDELARPANLGDPGRFDDEAGHVGREPGLVDDGVHCYSMKGWVRVDPACRARATHAPARICSRGRMAPFRSATFRSPGVSRPGPASRCPGPSPSASRAPSSRGSRGSCGPSGPAPR